jgi:heme-degrading monooxygenase HmoA
MIVRVWHGWTTFENADTYENLLKEEIFTGIVNRSIPGFREIQLLRRPLQSEVEFVTIMWFDSLDAVRAFAGEDYEVAVVPLSAQKVLSHFDARSQHYQLEEERKA